MAEENGGMSGLAETPKREVTMRCINILASTKTDAILDGTLGNSSSKCVVFVPYKMFLKAVKEWLEWQGTGRKDCEDNMVAFPYLTFGVAQKRPKKFRVFSSFDDPPSSYEEVDAFDASDFSVQM